MEPGGELPAPPPVLETSAAPKPRVTALVFVCLTVSRPRIASLLRRKIESCDASLSASKSGPE